MAIVKVASSGKSMLFIDDDGNVFVTSLFYMKKLVDGETRAPFVLLKRLPNKVQGKFRPSPLVGGEWADSSKDGGAFDKDVIAKNKERALAFKDVVL